MGIIRFVFALILITVFLHPVHAEPDKKVFLMMVCSCGKPAFLIAATSDVVKVYGLPQNEELIAACKSKDTSFEVAKILRTEVVTMESCPLSI